MIYKTFAEWKSLGCVVIAGEKSHKRNSVGVCVFSDEQVTEITELDESDHDVADMFGYTPEY